MKLWFLRYDYSYFIVFLYSGCGFLCIYVRIYYFLNIQGRLHWSPFTSSVGLKFETNVNIWFTGYIPWKEYLPSSRIKGSKLFLDFESRIVYCLKKKKDTWLCPLFPPGVLWTLWPHHQRQAQRLRPHHHDSPHWPGRLQGVYTTAWSLHPPAVL